MKKSKFSQLIEEYVESKKGSWSENTIRSERFRLRALNPRLIGEPAELYDWLKTERELKPYALKTSFIRAADFYEWLQERGEMPVGKNPLKLWMDQNAKRFKHVYVKERIELTFKEAIERIKQIEEPDARQKAMQLLVSGMRWEESQTYDPVTQTVVGKGGKPRRVNIPAPLDKVVYQKSYENFWHHLKKVGLKPHTLRKLYATELVEKGADIADLMAIMGWAAAQTATSYIQARKERELVQAIHQMLPEEQTHDPSPEQIPRSRRATAKGGRRR